MIVVLAIIGVALFAYGMWAYMNHDRQDFIDDPAVVETAERACAQMQRDIARAGEKTSLAARHAAENEAVLAMVHEIRQLGAHVLEKDFPSQPWLTDWEQLVEARQNGDEVPLADDQPVIERMNDLARDSGIDICRVPPPLLGT